MTSKNTALALPALCFAALVVSGCASSPKNDQTATCESLTLQPQAASGQILAACGEPTYRDAWGAPEGQSVPSTAAVEEWYYNRGPKEPLQVLRFLNGTLVSVRLDGDGFKPAKDKSCEPDDITQGLSKYRLVATCGLPITEQAYVMNPNVVIPNAPVFGQGNATIVGQGAQPVYREELTYKLDDSTQTVTLENGRVIMIGQVARR